MRIALDAQGGDHAPHEIVKGGLEAASELDGVELLLVGDRDKIQGEIDQSPHSDLDNVEIVHASQVVAMDESPVTALKAKRDSSIAVAVGLVKAGRADAVISAGNTGAAVASTTLSLRLLKGVKKAGIAAPYSTESKMCLLMDAGANINCKPIHLIQYAHMADIYVEAVFSRPNPTIGLLSIGEEALKGTDLIKETHQLLRDSDMNFVGNIEGQSICSGRCDIILCDGFAGNVVLKVSEGVATSMLRIVDRELKEHFEKDPEIRKSLGKVHGEVDFAEYGGAPLLGVNGVCLICHGRSQSRAIKNAVKVATQFEYHHINDKIQERIAQSTLSS